MITINDRVEQFIRDCESYNFNVKKLIECDERLEVIKHKLRGVSSVSPKGVIYENCGDPYKERKNDYLTEEEEVLAEKNKCSVSNDNVDKILLMINPLDRNMIKDRYVNKRHHLHIANKYGYCDISAIDKHIDSVLTKVFKALES